MISERKQNLLNSDIYEFAEFRLEAENLLLLRNSELLPLAPKAVEVLLALVRGGGRVVTKQEILETVWADTFVEEANLSHHIHALRKALGEDKTGRKFIETVPRRGYRFVAEIKTGAADAGAAEITVSERITALLIKQIAVEDGKQPPSIVADKAEIPRARGRNRVLLLWTTTLTASALILLIGAAFFLWRNFDSSKNNQTASSPEVKIKRLTPDLDVGSLAVSPDGASVVYAQLENEQITLWRKTIVSGEKSQLLPMMQMGETNEIVAIENFQEAVK